MILKLKIFLICFLCVISAFAANLPEPFIIKNITERKVHNVNQLQIQFTTNANNLLNWKLGFSMLTVLRNPKYDIDYQICLDGFGVNGCQSLDLIANNTPSSLKDVERPDLSSGHTTILSPRLPFALIAGRTYTITINNLPYLAKNISAMPHGFFLLDDKDVVHPIKVNNFEQLDYPESSLLLTHDKYINDRWLMESTNLKFDSLITPRPQSVYYGEGEFEILPNDNISIINKIDDEASFSAMINQFRSLIIQNGANVNDDSKKTIELVHCSDFRGYCSKFSNSEEGYRIDIKPTAIRIYSYKPEGLFYAYQTLKQLVFLYENKIPTQTIIDFPTYKYRGIMIDTVRHFFTVEQLKQVLDAMAAQKLNTLHLHIADDEGWRVELNDYPLLTMVGGKRYQGYMIGPSNLQDSNHDIANISNVNYETANTKYAGYYTHSQVYELMHYANKLQITIIPEIEMPGHARALKKSYPDVLYDFNQKQNFLSVQGYNDNVLPIYNYDKDSKFTQLVDGIVETVANLFTGQSSAYPISQEVSLSGDEVPKNAYDNMKDSSIISQEFFANLANNLDGYKISGWQQLVIKDDGTFNKNRLDNNQVGHIWVWSTVESRNNISALQITRNLLDKGYPVVADYADYAYLDMRYSPAFNEPGLYWANQYSDTWSAFQLGKIVTQFRDNNNFKGVEGALWSELIPHSDHLWYMLMPKMTGIAEAGWSNSEDDSWNDFAKRLGCGKEGFIAYMMKINKSNYRGYPNGISLEVPMGVCK